MTQSLSYTVKVGEDKASTDDANKRLSMSSENAATIETNVSKTKVPDDNQIDAVSSHKKDDLKNSQNTTNKPSATAMLKGSMTKTKTRYRPKMTWYELLVSQWIPGSCVWERATDMPPFERVTSCFILT